MRLSAPGPTGAAPESCIRWCRTTAPDTTPKALSSVGSRKRGARLSGRCVFRWRIQTFSPSCSARKTSTRRRCTFSFPGGRNRDFFSVGGWDGMHLIYEALKKTGGKTDAEALIAAAKGMKWESPRGPIAIDPETRDIVQTVYIRRVEKVGGRLVNVEIDKIENVKDPVKERMKK